MADEKILKAVEYCQGKDVTCNGCPLYVNDTKCGVYLTKYIQQTKNEPAPAPTGTSPNVKKLHTDNSTFLRICQEALLKVCDRIIEVDGDPYILGCIHMILNLINKEGENNAETN